VLAPCATREVWLPYRQHFDLAAWDAALQTTLAAVGVEQPEMMASAFVSSAATANDFSTLPAHSRTKGRTIGF
jgi:hypothetical protein